MLPDLSFKFQEKKSLHKCSQDYFKKKDDSYKRNILVKNLDINKVLSSGSWVDANKFSLLNNYFVLPSRFDSPAGTVLP